MKNAAFWGVALSLSCKNRRFGATSRLKIFRVEKYASEKSVWHFLNTLTHNPVCALNYLLKINFNIILSTINATPK
jgi:hypothetical protein